MTQSNKSSSILLVLNINSVLMVGCAGSDGAAPSEKGYNSELAEKLQGCGLLSEGKLTDGGGDPYVKCEQDCMLQQDNCTFLEGLVCNIDQAGYTDAYNTYAACVDACRARAPKFACSDGYEIPEQWKCNAYEDCSDGADETNCESTNDSRCSDGSWLPIGWVCDGYTDCDDGSDEGPECAKTQCDYEEY